MLFIIDSMHDLEGGAMCSSIFSRCRREQSYSNLEDPSHMSRWQTAKKVALVFTGIFFAGCVIDAIVTLNQSGPPYHTEVDLALGGGFLVGACVSTFVAYVADRRQHRAQVMAES